MVHKKFSNEDCDTDSMDSFDLKKEKILNIEPETDIETHIVWRSPGLTPTAPLLEEEEEEEEEEVPPVPAETQDSRRSSAPENRLASPSASFPAEQVPQKRRRKHKYARKGKAGFFKFHFLFFTLERGIAAVDLK